MGGRGSNGPLRRATPRTTESTSTRSPAEQAIRAAVQRLQSQPGEWIGLADLRDTLGEQFNRHDVDATLRAMLRDDPNVRLVPVANTKSLTQRDQDAAMTIGLDQVTAMTINPPSTEPAFGEAQPSPKDRILAAYQELATRPGGPVGLEKLREYLGADRNEVDRALIEMDDLREIHLEPDPDRRGLTAEAREAAVDLSGRPMHLLRVRPTDDEPDP